MKDEIFEKETYELIDLVQKHPDLYDTEHRNYFDAGCKNQAWEEIASNLNLSPYEAKTRWRGLRKSFTKCYKQEVTSGKFIIWRFYESMSFLKDYFRPRMSWSNSKENTKRKRGNEDDDDGEENHIKAKRRVDQYDDDDDIEDIFLEESQSSTKNEDANFEIHEVRESISNPENEKKEEITSPYVSHTRLGVAEILSPVLTKINDTVTNLNKAIIKDQNSKNTDTDNLICQTIVALIKEIPKEYKNKARRELFQFIFDLKEKYEISE